MGAEEERRVALLPELKDISNNIDILLTRITALAPTAAAVTALQADVTTLLARLTALRGGYLDQLDFNLAEAIAAIPTTMRGTDSAALATDMATVLSRLSAARAGYLDNLSAAVATNADMATVLSRLSSARAGYLDELAVTAPNMSWAGTLAKVIVPGTGADLDFPDVVVAGIPTGVTLKRATCALVVGFTLDTSTAENQIKTGTTDDIRIMLAGGSWGTNDLLAIPVPALSFETKLSDYGAGGPIFGNTDIKAIIANGTFNFRSEETNRTKAIEATGASLELHMVSIIISAWW
jgi:hypothetical protein